MHALEQLGYRAVLNTSAGRELIELIRPDVLAIGTDWARKDYYQQIEVTRDWLDDSRIIMAYVPYVQDFPISTSTIKQRVAESLVTHTSELDES